MKVKGMGLMGVLFLLLILGGQMHGQEQPEMPKLPEPEFAPGSPWLEETQIGIFLKERESYKSRYQWLAYVMRNVDLRKDPLEFRAQWTKKYLSQERRGYRKSDPFNYPPNLPEELQPRKGKEEESRQAVLARVCRDLKEWVRQWFVFQGIMVLNKEKYLMVTPTGRRTGFSAMSLKEGDTVPLGIVDVIERGKLFPMDTPVNGLLKVEVIQERFVVMKVGTFFSSDPTYVWWEIITCYPLTGVSNLYCY